MEFLTDCLGRQKTEYNKKEAVSTVKARILVSYNRMLNLETEVSFAEV